MIQFDNAVARFNALILRELNDELDIYCWVAGGAVRDFFLGKVKTTDIDLFFVNGNDWEKVLEYMIDNGGAKKFESDNGVKVEYNGTIFDLVKKPFHNPKACINEFDFTVSMFAVDSEKVYHGESSFIDLAKKQLMINKITFAASSMSRAFRYYQKGFRMCKEEQFKLLLAIHTSSQITRINTDFIMRGFTTGLPQEETSGLFRGID